MNRECLKLLCNCCSAYIYERINYVDLFWGGQNKESYSLCSLTSFFLSG